MPFKDEEFCLRDPLGPFENLKQLWNNIHLNSDNEYVKEIEKKMPFDKMLYNVGNWYIVNLEL